MKKQTIKMMSYNEEAKNYEEVYPESEVETTDMIPMFWCAGEKTWMTVPGTTADEVYDDWKSQIG